MNYHTFKEGNMSTDPSLSMSNILNAAEKLDSGMLSSVTKNIYLFQRKIRPLCTHTHTLQTDIKRERELSRLINKHPILRSKNSSHMHNKFIIIESTDNSLFERYKLVAIHIKKHEKF